MYSYYNPNPDGKIVGDCAVRAVAKALNTDWQNAYSMISEKGIEVSDMPSSDAVWGAVLREHGFRKAVIPNRCPMCYTADDFVEDNPKGVYVLGFGDHTATVVNGIIYDIFDSGSRVPIYFWYREEY